MKYSLYIQEREGLSTHDDEKGFFTYKIVENGIMEVHDLFVLPEYRSEGVGKEYAKLIEDYAREYDCTRIWCYTDKNANYWSRSHSYIESQGYKRINQEGTVIYYIKELKRG
jgi:GNAT superfamily N-acetyltransferase